MRNLLILLLLLCVPARAGSPSRGEGPSWVLVEKTPYLPLEGWEELTGFHSFTDEIKGRVLLERKGLVPLILLVDQPFALQGPRFLALPQSLLPRGGKFLLSIESAERLFLPALPKEERAKLEEILVQAKGRAEASSCLSERPVQRIFLDPGHGGEDNGTQKAGVKEKDVVLKFSRLVADELRRRGFLVTFSRTKDVYLPLEIRPKLAKEWKADLFLSLHVNSSKSSLARGTETYILSQEATDAEARKLALLENSIASEAKNQESAVQDILWDVEQTAYLQDSAYLASYIQESIASRAHELLRKKKVAGDWINRGVRQAPFYVLNRAAMPAILVEIGYLSNPHDRKLMGENFFQENLAKAIAEGVKKYKEACRKLL